MNTQFQRVAVTFILLLLSGVATAALYTNPPPRSQVYHRSIPDSNPSQWDIGVQAVWMRPSSTKNIFAKSGVVDLSPSPESGVYSLYTIDHEKVKPDFQWRFKIEGSYHFGGSAANIHLNWLRVDESTDNSVICEGDFNTLSAMSGDSICAPILTTVGVSQFNRGRVLGARGSSITGETGEAFSPDFPTLITGKSRFEFDVVNLVFGQHLDFQRYFKADLNVNVDAGIQFARVDHDFEVFLLQTRSGDTSAGPDYDVVTYTADFSNSLQSRVQGIGPTVGMDLLYEMGNGFSIVVNTRLALLYSTRKLEETASFGEVQTVDQVVGLGDATEEYARIVFGTPMYEKDHLLLPSVELTLGGRFTYDINETSSLLFDAGWRHIYMNHGDTYVDYHDDGERLANHAPVSLTGPYIGIKYMG